VFFNETEWKFWYPSAEALALCRACPVRVTCLDFALRNRMVGTWGGTSDYQRRMLKLPGVLDVGVRSARDARWSTSRTTAACRR
jgi:hypothetical protein